MKHKFDDAFGPYCEYCNQHTHLCTTDCPGRDLLSPSMRAAVTKGKLDFVDDEWVEVNKHEDHLGNSMLVERT